MIALIVCQAFALDRKALIRASLILFVVNLLVVKLTHACKLSRRDKAIYAETLMNRPLAQSPVLVNRGSDNNADVTKRNGYQSMPTTAYKPNYEFEEDRTFVFWSPQYSLLVARRQWASPDLREIASCGRVQVRLRWAQEASKISYASLPTSNEERGLSNAFAFKKTYKNVVGIVQTPENSTATLDGVRWHFDQVSGPHSRDNRTSEQLLLSFDWQKQILDPQRCIGFATRLHHLEATQCPRQQDDAVPVLRESHAKG